MPHPQITKAATLLAALLTLAACANNGGHQSGSKASHEAAMAAEAAFQERARKSSNGIANDGQFVLPEGDAAAKNLYDPSKPRLSTDRIKLDQPRDPKAELERRVIERWSLLIAKQGDLAFDYLTPGYRQTHDRAAYQKGMSSRPVGWSKAHFLKSDCESEDRCQVTTMVIYKVRMLSGVEMANQSALLHERWLRIDGSWYFLPEEAAL